ncbi:MAG: FliH/SctL family protein, partial [Nitrospinota bacterium]|nr:FliH/SctL family protein [Nitrospinota bacterium]
AKSLKSEFIHDLEQQRDMVNTSVAQEDVNELLADAMQKMKEEAAKAQEEAQQRGYEEGQEKGFKAGEQKVKEYFESSLEALKILIEQLSEVREKTYPLLEREMVEMVTTLAGKVVRTELAGRENGIREIVRMAVESVLDRESLSIKIHPEDHKALEDYGQELIQLFHEIKNVEFQPHASVARGHCIVESNFGTVEAGLDHLDEHIKRVLHLAPPPPLARPEETVKPEPPEEPIEPANMAKTEGEDIPIIDAEAFDDDLDIKIDEPDADDDPESSF